MSAASKDIVTMTSSISPESAFSGLFSAIPHTLADVGEMFLVRLWHPTRI
jgi:hypothetical protein